MLDIVKDRAYFIRVLRESTDDIQPEFGKMTLQHMIEHLILSVTWSNGNNPQSCMNTTGDAEKLKSLIIYSDYEMKPGLYNPLIGIEPAPLVCSSLEEAVDDLEYELQDFDEYYKMSQFGRQTDPMIGELGYREWMVYHGKHFNHHIGQFNLLKPIALLREN